jgi:PPM family protein phosphatase
MGATCAVAWVIADRLYTTNLGDSRIYLLRDGIIVQITTDHTWIQEALDAGIITNADRDEHPNAHVIRRYLGSKNSPELDFRLWYFAGEGDDDALKNQGLLLKPGDIVLLCSDGLTDLVSDKEIRDVILGSPLSKAPSVLIELANARGGHDNTTVVLLEMPKLKKGKTASKRKRQLLVGCLVMLVCTAVLITAIIFGFRWWEGRLDAEQTARPEQTLTLQADAPTLSASDAATPTVSIQVTEEPAGAQPSITPWPTHTSAP